MEYSELKKRHFGNNDTDKKLTDKEIIMCLERCVSRGNRNYNTDIVLDLIRRQKAEIDSAKAKIEICAEVIKRQDAEIKRLKECPKCVYEYDGETMEYCIRRKSDDKLFQFYAGTGKIMGFENKRGIHSLIRLLDDMRKEDEGKCQK